MKHYIANIVNDGMSIIRSKIFNVVSTIDEIDSRFPTLIVGWDTVKSYYPDANILNWKINDNIYWTHHKNVKRNRYEKDLKAFKEVALSKLATYTQYSSFNLFTANDDRISRMLLSFSDNRRKYSYVSGNELYVYYIDMKKVIGISLVEMEYIGLNKSLVLDSLNNGYNKIVYNDNSIPFEIKDRIENRKYMVPFLMHVFENE